MAGEHILIIEDDAANIEFLLTDVLSPHRYVVRATTNGQAGLNAAQEQQPDLVLLDLGLTDVAYAEMLQQLRAFGDPPVISLTPAGAEAEALHAIRLGARDALIKPFDAEEIAQTIARVLHQERLTKERDWLLRRLAGSNVALERSLTEAQTLFAIGKTISSYLDVGGVLTAVVDAAISITQAEEGYLLLRDGDSDELHLRAARSLGEKNAIDLCARMEDNIARQVVRTGEPIALSGKLDACITTSCHRSPDTNSHVVRSLVNVPIFSQKQVIGVLGVDNAVSERSFAQSDVMLLSALADFGSVAIQNAQVHSRTDQTLGQVLAEVSATQYKTDLILQHISEGVYTVDKDLRITSVNPAMERITGWQESELLGRYYDEVFVPQADGRRLSSEQTVPGRALRTQSPVVSTPTTILRKDDRRIWVTGRAVSLTATGVLGTMRDLVPETRFSQVQAEIQGKPQSRGLRLDSQAEDTLQSLQQEADAAPPHCHPVTLKPIITQVVDSFRGVASGKSFQVTLAPDLPFAVGNENKIELALVNLVHSALVLADPEQPIKIFADAGDDSVVVVVEGPGLPNPVKEPENRLPSLYAADEERINGAKPMPWWTVPEIRFHVARKLIQAQGGKVWTEHRSGTGTCFHLSLPKIEDKDVVQAFID